ncbi:hypothetical protein C8R44DRAFT_895737 [Mycena epipterygia]|nr:hypothetical protein C8R44DRAFT_895737 [Mycena epipterygia]
MRKLTHTYEEQRLVIDAELANPSLRHDAAKIWDRTRFENHELSIRLSSSVAQLQLEQEEATVLRDRARSEIRIQQSVNQIIDAEKQSRTHSSPFQLLFGPEISRSPLKKPQYPVAGSSRAGPHARTPTEDADYWRDLTPFSDEEILELLPTGQYTATSGTETSAKGANTATPDMDNESRTIALIRPRLVQP